MEKKIFTKELAMKVVIDKLVLATMMSRAQGGLSDKNFSYLGIKTLNKDKLQISVRDRVMAIYCDGISMNEQIGTVFVQAKLFSDIVRELPSGTISIATENHNQLVITAGKKNEFVMKLPLVGDMKWQEEPVLGVGIEDLIVPSSKFSYMIDQVQFCINQDSPRNYGTVGFFHKNSSNKLRLVGTDGFRLSFCEIVFQAETIENSPSSKKSFLKDGGVCISKRGLSELSRMSNEGFETVYISISEDGKTLLARVEGYQLYILLSSISFPNYQGVIPEYKPSQLNVSCESLQSVTRRVLLASDKTKTLKINLKKGSLTLSSRNLGSSEGYESIGLDSYDGPSGSFSVNGKFLTDLVSATMSESINIRFNNDDSPVLIIPSSEPKECRSQHVLVPIKDGN